MTARTGHGIYCHHTKEWSPGFSEDRHFDQDESYADYKRRIDAVVGDDIGIFVQDEESTEPFSQAEEIREFCESVGLADLKTGTGLAGRRRDAWLDDRSSPFPNGAEARRNYENPLNATTLYSLLKVKVLVSHDFHGRKYLADLSVASDMAMPTYLMQTGALCKCYISNLNPYYILALAETASEHQVYVLRDAIWKYLALQTSIRVKFSPRAFSIYQLQFHMAYFVLRPFPTREKSQQAKQRMKAPRNWTDLGFLEIQTHASKDHIHYGMHEAQMSFVICGPDSWRWAGYAFVDLEPDDEEFPEHNFPYDGHHDDPISLGSRLNANFPIWDPRAYFVTIVEDRMTLVLAEWRSLVRTVERSIIRYRSRHSSTLSQPPGKSGYHARNAKKTFDWTQQTIELLNQLLVVITKSIKTWEIFSSANGDINYFSNMEPPIAEHPHRRTQQSLSTIEDVFQQLEDLRQTLMHLENSCRQSAEALQLRLTLEGNDSLLHNGFATQLTVSILSPVALTIAFFSMPQAVVPFTLNSRSFTISLFIIMVVVRLLYVLLRAWPSWTHQWPNITASLKKWQLEAVTYRRMSSGRTSTLEETRGDLELQTMNV